MKKRLLFLVICLVLAACICSFAANADSQIDFDGHTITAKASVTVNLADYDATELSDKTFVGWKYEDGTYPETTVTLSAGQKLFAEYIDFNGAVAGDLSVIGAQMRNAEPMGLRYVSQIDGEYLRALEGVSGGNVEFGSAILPSNFHEGKILDAETEYSVGNKTYKASLVEAKKIFKTVYNENNEIKHRQFTVVLTNINPKNYDRDYTVRPYVRFTDYNGTRRFAYGEQYATSLYDVAVYASEHPEGLSDIALGTCYSIINTFAPHGDNDFSYPWGNF